MAKTLENLKLASGKLSVLVIRVLVIRVVVLGLFFGLVLLQSSLLAQELLDNSQKELPRYATWRVGDYRDPGGLANAIYRLEYSPDGRYLASRSQNNVVVVLDLKTRAEVCEVEGHENLIETIDFSPDGDFFMTASGDGDKVKIWKTQTGKLESEIDTGGVAAFFDKTGKRINVLGETHVHSYSWPGVQLTQQKRWKGSNEIAEFMSRDGRFVVAYRNLNKQFYQTLLIDTDSKSKVPLSGATGRPRAVKVSADNRWVAATYARDPKVRLWEIGEQGRYSLTGHEETVQSLSFSADNRFLVSSGWDQKVIVWDLLTRQSIHTFEGHEGNVNATACAPLDFALASGASGVKDCSLITWDMTELLFDQNDQPDVESELSLAEQFEPIWKSLGTSSLKLSLKSTSQLGAGGDYFLAALEEKIQSTISVNRSNTTDEYLRQLDDPEYSVRQTATEALLKMIKEVETRLREELKQTSSPEVKYRISMILKRDPPKGKSDLVVTRRWYRIVLALEQINTERSQAILKSVSLGHRSSEIAAHASESYQRNLKRRELGE